MTLELQALLDDESASVYRRALAADTLRAEVEAAKDKADAEFYAKNVIALGTPFLKTDAPISEKDEVYDALERAYITLAHNSFHHYLIALEWRRAPAERFYQPRIKVMHEFADAFTDMMVHDLYDMILFSMPPRVGKSSIALFGLSWLIGRDPSSPILGSAFAEKITRMFFTGIKEIYDDPDYNYRAIFPHLELVHTSADDLTLDFRNDGKKAARKYKSVTFRAIEASLHGSTEARQLLYCDDLVSGIEEALNPNRLQMLCDKMTTNLYSRKKQGCKELHVGTRWSIHDPIGLVERQNENNPRCKVIRIPALDEKDESNFDYPYGVGFDTDYYRSLRDKEDDVTWKCVYQQQPIEREGLLFPADELKYITSLAGYDPKRADDIFAFVDVAFGGGDYLSMPVAMQFGDDPPIIYDWLFNNGHYEVTEPLVAGKLASLGVRRAIFEANNGGEFYAKDVTGLLAKSGHKMQIVAVRAPSNKSKETRIIQHSPAIRNFVFLDPNSKDASPEYRLAMQQLTSYTVSGKNQHDDAPDSAAGLATMQRTNLNATVTVYDRKHI